MAVGDFTGWKIGGSLGSAAEHGYVRFFKERYSDNIYMKSQALKNTLGAYVQREVLNGAPIQLRAHKKPADIGTADLRGGTGVGGSNYNIADTTSAQSYQFISDTASDWSAGPRKNVDRFSEFDYYTLPTEYRTLSPDHWSLPHAYDWRDKGALMRDAKPDAGQMMAVMGVFERAIDRYIIMAQDSDVLVNDADDTTPGTTLTTYVNDGGSSIAFDFGEGEQTDEILSGRSLTTAKLREARRILEENEAIASGQQGIIVAVHPRQVSHLIQDPEVKSYDFNTVRPLADGQVISWMGMTIVPTTQLFPIDTSAPFTAATTDPWGATTGNGATSTGRYVHVFTRDAITLGVDPVVTKMDVVPHKQHLLQVAHYSSIAAIRMDGKKTCRIECVDGV